MTFRKPVWFCDVDGVVNALDGMNTLWGYEYGTASPTADWFRTFPITWNPLLIERMNALIDAGAVDIRWLTTWGSGANLSLRRLIGIRELPVAYEPQPEDNGEIWWKREAVVEFMLANPDVPVIWTDDELTSEEFDAVDGVYTEREGSEAGVMMFRPDDRMGITYSQMTRIEEFIHDEGRADPSASSAGAGEGSPPEVA